VLIGEGRVILVSSPLGKHSISVALQPRSGGDDAAPKTIEVEVI